MGELHLPLILTRKNQRERATFIWARALAKEAWRSSMAAVEMPAAEGASSAFWAAAWSIWPGINARGVRTVTVSRTT
jgi:hypothetical protein